MKLTIVREPHDTYTYGVLSFDKYAFQTIERPWKDNQQGVSCVPRGTYQLVKHDTESHPKTWALVNPALNVIHWPDPQKPTARTVCLIHPANIAAELRGCIAPGFRRGLLTDIPAVLESRAAMARIQELLTWDDSHTLEIK